MKYSEEIYFDQAATSYPKPPCVLEAVKRALTEYGGNPGRSGHRLSLGAAECVFSVREALCRFFDAPSAERVIFTKNATEALNLIIFSVLKNGGHALCSDMEHNAVLRPLLHLKREGRADFDVFESKELTEEGLKALLRPDTRLLVLNHASNICGRVLDAERIGRFCEGHGIVFVLDASQSAGHIPISMQKMKVDVLCAPAHKGLYGIMGAGFAIFRREMNLPPFMHGGSGVHSLASEMPSTLPERYEAGTLAVPAIAALGASLADIKEKGVGKIHGHIESMERCLGEGLTHIRGIRVLEKEARGSGILSFVHESLSPAALAERLDDAGVAVRSGYHCAPLAHRTIGSPDGGTVRIGLGASNTLSECEHFLERLEKITTSEISY